MPPFELSNQLGVAVLAVVGSLALRRLALSERVHAVVPTLLCVAIFVFFVDLSDIRNTLLQGLVSGLLASGILYIVTGLLGIRD